MKSIIATIIVITSVITAVLSRPQYGSGGNTGCVTEFKEIKNITTKEEFRKVCNPVKSRACVNSTRSKCWPTTEQECKTENREKCWTSTRTNCVDEVKDVEQPYSEDVCKDVNVRVCEKGWVEQNYNDKIWADLPDTCKELPQTKCEKVQRVRWVKEKKQNCTKVPFRECKTAPEKRCTRVRKQKCRDEPFQDCKDVTKEVCEEKHVQVPVPITQKVAVQVCKD